MDCGVDAKSANLVLTLYVAGAVFKLGTCVCS